MGQNSSPVGWNSSPVGQNSMSMGWSSIPAGRIDSPRGCQNQFLAARIDSRDSQMLPGLRSSQPEDQEIYFQ